MAWEILIFEHKRRDCKFTNIGERRGKAVFFTIRYSAALQHLALETFLDLALFKATNKFLGFSVIVFDSPCALTPP
jgi:hypothetical protein